MSTPRFGSLRNKAMKHLHVLAEDIGPRPATSENLRNAAEYVLGILKKAKVNEVRVETFVAGRDTYWPYVLAMAAGWKGNLLAFLFPHAATRLLAGVLNAAGAWAFFKQSDFEANWARDALPKREGRNVIARIVGEGEIRHRIVLTAHLDTHRTPRVYQRPQTLKLFSTLVSGSFAALAGSAAVQILRFLFGRPKGRWWELLALTAQSGAIALALQGETTPHTPGANDNASGAAVVLTIAEYLARHPLPNTEVWVVFTDCEEVGAYGMSAFLSRYGDELQDACFINVDMVGMGTPAIQFTDGLIRKHTSPPGAVAKALQVIQEHPEWHVLPAFGAYTDATVAKKYGFKAFTITHYLPPEHPARPYGGYWHQMRDEVENIEPEAIQETLRMIWALLQACAHSD